MITAGEPQEFIPLGREHLKIHPGDVYLPNENVQPAPAATNHCLTRDLLKALQGVTLKDHNREQWFLKGNTDGDSEEEFYWNGKTVIWSKSSGHGIRKVQKTFTMEEPVLQVLWTEFRIRSCKPRIMDAEIEMEDQKETLSGICIVENSALSVFGNTGEDFVVTTPFQVSRVWSSMYGVIFERNLIPDGKIDIKTSQIDNLPVIFSMMHPLDDIAPVIKRTTNSNGIQISYFCDSSEEIVFCSSDFSLVMTYNKKGYHSVWRLRTTTFQEADYACSKIQMDAPNRPGCTPSSTSASTSSRLNRIKMNASNQTPVNTSSPFQSYHSSRVASPAGRSFSPSVPGLTHMATLSRSQPPSLTSSMTHPHSYTPLTSRSLLSPEPSGDFCKFIEPLAPDICFDYEWSTKQINPGIQEKALKVFISKDITGHSFLCYFLKGQQILQLVKFEEMKPSNQYVFGSSAEISAVDAEVLPDLNLIIIVEPNFTLTLYTGLIKVCKVHVADIFGLTSEIMSSSSQLPSVCFTTPRRESLISSTRPPSANCTRFGDESQILSPVPMVIDEVAKSVLNEDMSFFNVGLIKSVNNSVRRRVTLETTAGYYRLQIPEVTSSRTVSKCLQALQYVLPRDIYTQIFIKWYLSRNAPGPNNVDSQQELNTFLMCLLSMIGFDSDKITLGDCVKNDSFAPAQVKRQKTHEKGCDEDWAHLISNNPQKQNIEARFLSDSVHKSAPTEAGDFNSSAILFPYTAYVLISIHLIYEESKLDVSLWNDLSQLCGFLSELARELRQYTYLDYYWKDFPFQFNHSHRKCILPDSEIQKVDFPKYISTAPSIYCHIKSCLSSKVESAFPYIPQVTTSLYSIVLVYAVLTSVENPLETVKNYLFQLPAHGISKQEPVTQSLLSSCYKVSSNPKKCAVMLITKLGLTIKDINSLPIGIALPIKDALLFCWHEPSGLCSKEIFDLIGRRDLSSLKTTQISKIQPQPMKSKLDSGKNPISKDNVDDGLNHLDMEVLRLRFGKDHRVHDVYQMLQSSKPVQINLQQRLEVSDHEFIEEQERHLYNICIRTMAATVGRGMFTLRAYHPVVTETLPIPKLCLTGRAPPRNTTVDLSHIDVPPNMSMWPLFHNGVAAGLSISLNASKIDSTWMVYNKPKNQGSDMPMEHAGFLMALGLNGHLSRLTTLSIHDYLCKGHELTSVGIILGVSAAKRGTMDLGITKLLSIHIEALLPPTSTELDVPPAVQVAAVMGLGLLYQGTGHHPMAEVLLGEIGRPPGPEMEHSIDRESYSLAAGLALGLITFGKGKEMSGLREYPMADQLYHYMVGGHKRPLTGIHKEKHKSPSYQIREGDNVNVDVTSPGATLALGMMFFNTDNHSIADWMVAPDTQFLLDMVRPDFLLLRTISKGLILWSSVHPSKEWIDSHLPEIVSKYAFQRGRSTADVDFETMSQAYCYIIAGGCFCIGLKFAGSANAQACDVLLNYAKEFLKLTRKHHGDQAGKSTTETCLNVAVLSLAMVMAGTGDLDVIRICRHLRTRITQAASYVLYGSHIATHMALGLLFLGGGRYTLSTSPLAIGAMICAFFPKFPQHSNDNRYHLQAFYHLYVLAVEPRLIVPRLIDSNKPVYINMKVKFKDTDFYQGAEYSVKAPCILPELKFLKEVIVEDSRYWPIVFNCEENADVLHNLLENGGVLHVMQNAGCLPYSEDPQGFRSLQAQSYIWNNVHAWNIKTVQISHFSSDPVALNFANCFLVPADTSEQEKEWQQKMCGFLFECASLEKMEALPICVAMIQMSRQTSSTRHTFDLWQIKMLSAYEKWNKQYSTSHADPFTLLRPDLSLSITSHVEQAAKNSVKDYKHELYQYLTKYWTVDNGAYPNYSSKLVGFLLLHDINGIKPLDFNITGVNTMPYLYNQLQKFNVSVSSVMSIVSVLSP